MQKLRDELETLAATDCMDEGLRQVKEAIDNLEALVNNSVQKQEAAFTLVKYDQKEQQDALQDLSTKGGRPGKKSILTKRIERFKNNVRPFSLMHVSLQCVGCDVEGVDEACSGLRRNSMMYCRFCWTHWGWKDLLIKSEDLVTSYGETMR